MRNDLVGRTTLGDNLRRERLARGFTAAELGHVTGVAPSAITTIELGRVPNPGVLTMYAIATALGVRMEDLMGVTRVDHTTKGRSRARERGAAGT